MITSVDNRVPHVGDEIAYVVRRGSRADLKLARVAEVTSEYLEVVPTRGADWERHMPRKLTAPTFVITEQCGLRGAEYD